MSRACSLLDQPVSRFLLSLGLQDSIDHQPVQSLCRNDIADHHGSDRTAYL
jgi:hypothetical protein